MSETMAVGLPSGLEELRERVDGWRRTRQRRTEMPAELWGEVIAVARQGRPYAVARALRVNFEALRRRMAEAAAQGQREQAASFIEVTGADLLGAMAPTPPAAVVEVTDREGGRLCVRLAAGSPVDVAGIVAAFRRAGT